MDDRDDTFDLYDLRVEVVATARPFVCGHHAGDSFELRGENLSQQFKDIVEDYVKGRWGSI